MKSIGKSLILSLVLTVAIALYLNMESVKGVKSDVQALDVAAGNVALSDPTSPDPLVHCYGAANADALDIRTRMDFEARTSGGWVPAPDQAKPGQFCLIESPGAVAKRLADLPKN